MKPFHILVATLSLGGTLAAVSATHAATFDPVPMTGSMGTAGNAVSVPCEALLMTSPRPCTKTIVRALRGSVGNAAVEALSEEALDLGSTAAAPSLPLYLQAGDVVVPVYIERPMLYARGGAVARSAQAEGMLDVKASRSDR